MVDGFSQIGRKVAWERSGRANKANKAEGRVGLVTKIYDDDRPTGSRVETGN